MILKSTAVLCAVLAAAIVRAVASSPAAWTSHYAEEKSKCIAASGLQDAKALDRTGFSDEIGYDAVRIEGRESGATVYMVCLFNRKTRKAVTAHTTSPFPSRY
jgi:hypothetical protein